MKAYMKREIKSILDAKIFIINLVADEKDFHFDDKAEDIIDRYGKNIFTKAESKEIDKRTSEMNFDGNLIWHHFQCQFGYSLALHKFLGLLQTYKKIKKSVPIYLDKNNKNLTTYDVENILCILNEMLDVLAWTPDHTISERDALRDLINYHFDTSILN